VSCNRSGDTPAVAAHPQNRQIFPLRSAGRRLESGSNAYYGIGRHLASKQTFSEDRNHPHNRVSLRAAAHLKL
jgi:hypothetical protein